MIFQGTCGKYQFVELKESSEIFTLKFNSTEIFTRMESGGNISLISHNNTTRLTIK